MKILKCILIILVIGGIAGCNISEEKADSNNSSIGVSATEEEQKKDTNDEIYASIGGRKISQEEMDYECFRIQLQDALAGRPTDGSCPPEETLISQIVEIKAIDYLAEVKGVNTTSDEVTQRINKLKEDLAESSTFKEMVQSFDEEKFWKYEEQRYLTIVNTERIKGKLIQEEKEKYSYHNEETIKYNAEKQFDELLVEAVGLVDTTIFYH